MTPRPRRGTPTACALLLALMAGLCGHRPAGGAAEGSERRRRRHRRSGPWLPARAFTDRWEQAALLAEQATGGVVVEVDAEDTADTFEVDVVRKGVEIDLDVNVVTGRMTQIGRWAAGD